MDINDPRLKAEWRQRIRTRLIAWTIVLLVVGAIWFGGFAPYPTRYRIMYNGEFYAGEYRDTWFPRWVQFTSEHRQLVWVHYYIAQRQEREAAEKAKQRRRWRVLEESTPGEQNYSISPDPVESP